MDRYLIKNGTLLSILDGSERKADVLVENGVITRIAENIEAPGTETFDAAGMFVTVGWLEAHCHFLRPGGAVSLDPTDDLLRQGITYALDLGTVGPDDYVECTKAIRAMSELRFRAYLNIGHAGVYPPGKTVDFEGPEDIIPELVVEVGEKYRDELMGLKARIDDKFCFDPVYVMEQLRALGDKLDMPIAVHAPRSRIGIEKLLTYMKAGDVLCHTLAGNSDVMSIIDENGNVKPCVLEARARGVIFDLSHGTRPARPQSPRPGVQPGRDPDQGARPDGPALVVDFEQGRGGARAPAAHPRQGRGDPRGHAGRPHRLPHRRGQLHLSRLQEGAAHLPREGHCSLHLPER